MIAKRLEQDSGPGKGSIKIYDYFLKLLQKLQNMIILTLITQYMIFLVAPVDSNVFSCRLFSSHCFVYSAYPLAPHP